MKRIMINRRYSGFGDWIMMASVIKMINKQRYDVEVYFDATGVKLGSWLADYMRGTDIRAFAAINPHKGAYDAVIDHLVYDLSTIGNKHLIEGMVDAVRAAIPNMKLEYDASCLAQYKGPLTRHYPYLHDKYVLMPSVGACAGRGNPTKEWGFSNFMDLAELLHKDGVTVVQLAAPGDPVLDCLKYPTITTHGIGEFHYLVTRASMVVSLENGLSHYAGHHHIPCATIYMPNGPCRPCNTVYPTQVAITGELITPEYVHDAITFNLRARQEIHNVV